MDRQGVGDPRIPVKSYLRKGFSQVAFGKRGGGWCKNKVQHVIGLVVFLLGQLFSPLPTPHLQAPSPADYSFPLGKLRVLSAASPPSTCPGECATTEPETAGTESVALHRSRRLPVVTLGALVAPMPPAPSLYRALQPGKSGRVVTAAPRRCVTSRDALGGRARGFRVPGCGDQGRRRLLVQFALVGRLQTLFKL